MAHICDPKRANLVLFGGPFDGRVHDMTREELDFYVSRRQPIRFPIFPAREILWGFRGATDDDPKPGMLKTAEYKIHPVETSRGQHPAIIFYYGEFYG